MVSGNVVRRVHVTPSRLGGLTFTAGNAVSLTDRNVNVLQEEIIILLGVRFPLALDIGDRLVVKEDRQVLY